VTMLSGKTHDKAITRVRMDKRKNEYLDALRGRLMKAINHFIAVQQPLTELCDRRCASQNKRNVQMLETSAN
jgi:hypothetical protein